MSCFGGAKLNRSRQINTNMNFVIGTNENIVPKYFLQDLAELKIEKGKSVNVVVAGIVTQIATSKAGGDMAAFLLEDTTAVFRCEFYYDRCAFGENFVEGMPVKIKGELRYNNFEELVIRVFKISRF